MGMYIQEADMVNRFGQDEIAQLTNRTNPLSGTYDATTLDQVISDAEAELNSYLADRYTLPLPTVPEVLPRLCCDIARFYLWGERANEVVTLRYQNAIKFLLQVASGAITLGLDATDKTQTMASGPSYQQLSSSTTPALVNRTFTSDLLSDYSL